MLTQYYSLGEFETIAAYVNVYAFRGSNSIILPPFPMDSTPKENNLDPAGEWATVIFSLASLLNSGQLLKV